MSEKHGGIDIKKTGQKDWSKGYHISDMETLFSRGDWASYDDVIKWLEDKGEQDNELTPGEVVAMKEDLENLKKKGVEFSKNPREICSWAEHCKSGG